jgi:hypothetical protein
MALYFDLYSIILLIHNILKYVMVLFLKYITLDGGDNLILCCSIIVIELFCFIFSIKRMKK